MIAALQDINEILDELDAAAGRNSQVDKRRAPRRFWRKPLKLWITHPGGNRAKIAVLTRNLSCGGLSFLYTGYLHVGTRCEMQLITVDNAWVDIAATVVRCRYIVGRIHEVSLSFATPVDDSLFVSQELSASILLVDDDEDTLRLTGHLLARGGAKLVTANRGVQALELVAEHDFDLVLLDVEMPGISGPQVARTLRERGVHVPIIACTANDDQGTRDACLAAGCNEFLAKPLGRGELIETIVRYLTVKEPIVSKHAGVPEMAELIRAFVHGLPARIQKMHGCLRSRKVQQLGALARQLKVAASDHGGYGFGEISAAADKLAQAVTECADWECAEEAMLALESLSHRVKEDERMVPV